MDRAKFITKSKYVRYVQCPRMFYFDEDPTIEKEISVITRGAIEQGIEVGKAARALFGAYKLVSTSSALEERFIQTKELLKSEDVTIAEAAFIYGDLYCAVDLLTKRGETINIYEVKSTTEIKKEHYYDTAFQYYVLRKLGYDPRSVNIVYVNSEYVRQGLIDITRFLRMDDVLGTMGYDPFIIEDNLDKIRALKGEPRFLAKSLCIDCEYKKKCFEGEPGDSILKLASYLKRNEYYNDGIKTFRALLSLGVPLKERQMRQIDFYYSKGSDDLYINRDAVRRFLKTISYPVYFLDFETMSYVFPPFDGMRPNQNLPFQYSLHILDGPSGNLRHEEYLASSLYDFRREVTEKLLGELKEDSSIIAFHASFEQGILRNMAEWFPEHRERIAELIAHFVDLEDPFKKEFVYKKDMQGRSSIKVVYPAMCPEHKEAYHDLEGVHNGGEAMEAFERLRVASRPDKEQIMHNLLKYCELDTMAMVELFFRLKEMANDEK